MKSIFIVFYLFFFSSIYAQNISEINSNNVLSYLTTSATLSNNQYGNSNSIELILSNQVKNISIFQEGINNNLNYFDYINQNIMLDNELIMKGVNNTVTIYGSNSISQNMNIEINANNKNITVINR